MKNLAGIAFPLAIILVAGLMLARINSGVVETPEVFAQGLTLQQAAARADESGKPVLVFVTADWCAPCQAFKRSTLSQENVKQAILERTEPVYLDITNVQANPEAVAAAEAMGVRGIPALVLLRDGKVISHRGPMTDTQLIGWLNEQ